VQLRTHGNLDPVRLVLFFLVILAI
jgi:hypothetical protein